MGGATRQIEIDALYHGQNWQPRKTFVQDVERFSQQASWVTEWSYSAFLGPMLSDRADLMVWLDLPRWQISYQITTRTVRRRLARQELWNGNIEPPLRTFFTDPRHVARYAIVQHHRKRRRLLALAQEYQELPIVRCTTHRQAATWVVTVLRNAVSGRMYSSES
jgi:adenylate kinase family enzyme